MHKLLNFIHTQRPNTLNSDVLDARSTFVVRELVGVEVQN
jgi:hypothetical protein